MADQKQEQQLDYTPNIYFTETDVQWLKEHGFRDATGNGHYWEKELNGATMDVYKHSNSFYVCRAADNDCYLDTDRMGHTLKEAIENACKMYKKRSETTAKAAATLVKFAKEHCQ